MEVQSTNSPLQSDSLLNTDSTLDLNLGIMVDEPVIDRGQNLVIEDDSEVLVIPEISKIEFLIIPIEPINEVPPSLADELPIQTTVEDGELIHTFIVSEMGV